MGFCASCPKDQTSKKWPLYSKEPSDIYEYMPQKLNYKLQKLFFEGEIENIEIVNYSYDLISINFIINDILQFSLPRQRNQTNLSNRSSQIGNLKKIKWKMDQKFCFSMDQYEIRKNFIRISIFNESIVPILQLKLNLYQVITGPFHHDLALQFQDGKNSRLLFDFKISQVFQILINPLEISVHLNQQYPGNQFNYSFNAYSCSQKVCTSEGSIPKKASIFTEVEGKYRELKPEDQCQSPTKIRKGTNFNKMIKNVMSSQIMWSKSEQIQTKFFQKESQQILSHQKAMPSLKFSLKSNQLSKSVLQFNFWNIQIKNSLINQAIIFADCYLSIAKILQGDCVLLQQLQDCSHNNGSAFESKKIRKKIQSRVVILQDQLIRDGKLIGKVKIKLKAICQTHFSQLYLYAKTQDGILYMNSMFKIYTGKSLNKQININILKIQQLFESIATSIFQYNQKSKEKRKNWIQYIHLQEQIFQQFNRLHRKLDQTLQQSFVLSKRYQIGDMIDTQNLILNILERIYIFLEEDNVKFAQQSWKLMFKLMKRGQLYLQNIGFYHFDQTCMELITQQKPEKCEILNGKIKIRKIATALKYQQVLFKTLNLSLKSQYTTQNNIILQIQAFKAYCYLRVPCFRQQVLKNICKSQDNHMLEESYLDLMDLDKKVSHLNLKIEQKSSTHLDWNKYFYNYLKDQDKYHELNKNLIQNFEDNQWLSSLSRRQESFFTFLQYFSKKMAEVGKRLKLCRYSYCSGYNKIIQCFLVQIKKRSLIDIDSSMIETSTYLLANQNLINILIPTFIQKTNLYDSLSINKLLNIITSYLKYLTQNATVTIPQKFNHVYFFKVIKMILESQYSYGVAKMLVILHIYFQSFNQDFKQVLSLYLLSKAFFRLFFHWSYNVRIIFYHIFIIKIYWSKLNGVTEKQNKMESYKNENQQIYDRYKKLIKILNTVQRQRLIKKKNMKKVQKEEYYVKMKKKIYEKIKLKNNQNSIVKSKDIQSSSSIIDCNQSQPDSQKQIFLGFSNIKKNQGQNHYNRSQTLCSDQIKQNLKSLRSSKINSMISLNQVQTVSRKFSNHQNEQQNDIDKFSINLKISNHKRINGGMKRKQGTDTSIKEQIQKINQNSINLLPITHKQSSEEKPLIYTFFGNQDYELEVISLNQQNKVLMGMGQFREIQQFVEKYILSKGVSPHVNLDPEIQIDTNQPRPQQLIYI